MRRLLLVLAILLGSVGSAAAEGTFSVNIGINVPAYPQLVPVPGYPVYYAPQLNANYFFYDGLYWVYDGDNWFTSTWYDGPWELVQPEAVPLFVLRVPVRYYRRPPSYFGAWASSAPPRWGEHWGPSWESRHRGWDNWDRSVAVAPAPLPIYQRQYAGTRYPQVEQQLTLQSQNYRYRPHEPTAQQAQRSYYAGRTAPSNAQQQSQVTPQTTSPPLRQAQPQQDVRRDAERQAQEQQRQAQQAAQQNARQQAQQQQAQQQAQRNAQQQAQQQQAQQRAQQNAEHQAQQRQAQQQAQRNAQQQQAQQQAQRNAQQQQAQQREAQQHQAPRPSEPRQNPQQQGQAQQREQVAQHEEHQPPGQDRREH